MKKSTKKSVVIFLGIAAISFVSFSSLLAEDKHSNGILSSSDAAMMVKGSADIVSETKVSGQENSAGVITNSDYEFISKPYSKPSTHGTLAAVDDHDGIISAVDSSFTK